MAYALIDKETDIVISVQTTPVEPESEDTVYEIQTDHKFLPPPALAKWQYEDGTFTNVGEQVTLDEEEVNDHLTQYMGRLNELNYSGNPLDIDEMEDWWDTKIEACETLEELKTVIKVIIKVLGRAQSATLYGWKLKKEK